MPSVRLLVPSCSTSSGFRHASKVTADDAREDTQPDDAADDRDDDEADSELQPNGGRSSSRRSFSCAPPPLHAEHDGADSHGKGGGEQDPEPRDIGRLRNRAPRKEAFEGCIILFIQNEPNPPCQELDHEGQNPEDERGRRGAIDGSPACGVEVSPRSLNRSTAFALAQRVSMQQET